jgi:hypothetical protein
MEPSALFAESIESAIPVKELACSTHTGTLSCRGTITYQWCDTPPHFTSSPDVYLSYLEHSACGAEY